VNSVSIGGCGNKNDPGLSDCGNKRMRILDFGVKTQNINECWVMNTGVLE
jgi:hypothetical protein